MNTIVFDDAVQALKELAAERPDYVYERDLCVYTHENGEPGCIVGHVLDRLGLPRPGFDESRNTQGIRMLGFDMDDRTRRLLEDAQEYQDDRETWGAAVEIAVETAEARP